MVPHRSGTLLAIIIFVGLLLFIFSSPPSTDPATGEPVSGPAKYVPRPQLPSWGGIHFPFQPSAHVRPKEQKNSTSGESKWYSDWTWLYPFSSSITLDENRSVLPPLADRPVVYTYYEPNKGNGENEDADARMLLAWRRAWYAKGFRPVILSHAEAMDNQLYEAVQRIKQDPTKKFSPELESDFFRWLAWGQMGTGLLADWRCFPMAKYDDELLSYLRRGAVPTHITRFDHLGNGLFAGESNEINEAIKEAIRQVDEHSNSMLELIPAEHFKTEKSTSLAFYSPSMITNQYPMLAEKIVSSPSEGKRALVDMVNSHLHNTFQNSFPAGIAVLKPFPEKTTALIEPSLRLAKALVRCAESADLSTCPPNIPACHVCSPSNPVRISQPAQYKNTTHVFTIGTLPHPYTLLSLQQNSEEVTTRHIRRETARDPWLTEVTKELLGDEMGGFSRSSVLKNAVAGEMAIGNSVWLTVESLPSKAGESLPPDSLDELEWQLGFKIPRDDQTDAKKEEEARKSVTDPNPSKAGIEREYELLDKAREVMKTKDVNRIGIKDVAEAWNLADTEVWRFVRAYRARSIVERKKWEEEEKYFAGPKLAV
ncbi:hypothetical protein ASPZODRAFT_150346 [Penicilliopsis zonata CBS 506.65]|uniref:Uncharacterized protein n=1 Tax=Penicilliopsis zonata CBS 506.65 TaxID=1073090 RepID=A0A1L9SQV9_9EURO|nr:hypothetical protein ASPZODRAFT_150346 [Penicilliopsis zonata CBS 506.65]OJJ49461.1 hypothetical protein ASPZODRAFT_150346 [Penicilliopsis zonata CBS 506.65]